MLKFRFLGLAALAVAGMTFGLTQTQPTFASSNNNCVPASNCTAATCSYTSAKATTNNNNGGLANAYACGHHSSATANANNGAVVGAVANGYEVHTVATGNGSGTTVVGGAANGEQNVIGINTYSTNAQGAVINYNPWGNVSIGVSANSGSVAMNTNETTPPTGGPTGSCQTSGSGMALVFQNATGALSLCANGQVVP